MKLKVEVEMTKSEVLEAITDKIREDFRYRLSNPFQLGRAIEIEGLNDDSFIVKWEEKPEEPEKAEEPVPAPAAPAVEPVEVKLEPAF